MIRYLKIYDILDIHYDIMMDYDELEQAGILFEEPLRFAVDRPAMISFGEELYPTIWLKAAALVQSIAQGHLFRNGNKRTGLACLHVFLLVNGYKSLWSSQEAEDFMLHIITDKKFKDNDGHIYIAELIKKNSVKIEV